MIIVKLIRFQNTIYDFSWFYKDNCKKHIWFDSTK